MHLEPHHAPSSWAEFFKQYAMIVLSILTALALERAAVALHDRAAARDSRAQIEAELAANATELQHSQTLTRGNIAHAKASLSALVAVLQAPQPDPTRLRTTIQPMLDSLSINPTSWQRQAWDSALADQSANHLPAADLSRYRTVYATQRDFADIVKILIGGEWLTDAVNLKIDFRTGKVDGRQAAHVLGRYLLVLEQIESGEDNLSALIAGKPITQAQAPARP